VAAPNAAAGLLARPTILGPLPPAKLESPVAGAAEPNPLPNVLVEPRLPKPDDPSVVVGFAAKALPNVEDFVSVEAPPPKADGLSLSAPKPEPVEAKADVGLVDAAAPKGDCALEAADPKGEADLAKEPKPDDAKAEADVCAGGDFEADVANGEAVEVLANPLDDGN
jgi:hypothetical protein